MTVIEQIVPWTDKRLNKDEATLLQRAYVVSQATALEEFEKMFTTGFGNTEPGRHILNDRDFSMSSVAKLRRTMHKLQSTIK